MTSLTLFGEVTENVMNSITAFALSDVRRIARRQTKSGSEQELSPEDCQKVLELPIKATDFFDVWDNNKEIFEQGSVVKAQLQEGVHFIKTRDYIRNVFNPYIASIEATSDQFGDDPNSFDTKKAIIAQRTCEFAGDENEETECVHFVLKDDSDKRIILVFRGSATRKDWMQDAQCVLASIPNPIPQHLRSAETPDTLGIHRGFRHYLYDPLGSECEDTTSTSATSNILLAPATAATAVLSAASVIPRSLGIRTSADDLLDEGKSEEAQKDEKSEEISRTEEKASPTKLQIIMDQLRTLKEKYPTYRIYITGHSLGGALALIAALEVASDPFLSVVQDDNHSDSADLKAPVACFTFGNPKVGNQQFVEAFQQLEESKRLHCLCFHNSGDVVPMIPAWALGFRHVGLRCVLHSDGRFELGHANASDPIFCQCYGHQPQNSNPLVQALGYFRKDTSNSGDSGGLLEEEGPEEVRDEKSPGAKRELSKSSSLIEDSEWVERDHEEKVGSLKDRVLKIMRTTSKQKEEPKKQQRINLHDYREYLERLLRLKNVLTETSMVELYQEWYSTLQETR